MNKMYLSLAVESFREGVEHWARGTDADLCFSMIHLDYAIDSLLKQIVFDNNSKALINWNDKRGYYKNIQQMIRNIRDKHGVQFKDDEIKHIEMLREIRNYIQHRGLIPHKFIVDGELYFIYPFFKDKLSLYKMSPAKNDSLTELLKIKPEDMLETLIEKYNDYHVGKTTLSGTKFNIDKLYAEFLDDLKTKSNVVCHVWKPQFYEDFEDISWVFGSLGPRFEQILNKFKKDAPSSDATEQLLHIQNIGAHVTDHARTELKDIEEKLNELLLNWDKSNVVLTDDEVEYLQYLSNRVKSEINKFYPKR